tara:strand:+ start:1142 stop:1270 length:129 start_codon:yes stop_codon:yes gene_type:complete
MVSVTTKYKYLEALSIIKDDFYGEDVKEKYREIVKEYLTKNK